MHAKVEMRMHAEASEPQPVCAVDLIGSAGTHAHALRFLPSAAPYAYRISHSHVALCSPDTARLKLARSHAE